MEYPRMTRNYAANTAYVAFKEIGDGEAVDSVPVEDKRGNIFLVIDLSVGGQVLGLEFLNAKAHLPESTVK